MYDEAETSAPTIVATEGQIVMPFYIVCDVSGSMYGDMPALNSALRDLYQDIVSDPVVDDLTMLSIITFHSTAHTVVPLAAPSDITLPTLQATGGTNFGAAFRELHRALQKDKDRLKSEGRKVFRPCVFFLTDGEPLDADYLQTFKSLFAYDPDSKVGNKAFPYVVTFGFRDAPKHVMQQLAYPDFGTSRGKWFVSRDNNVGELLKSMTAAIGNTVLSSGQSAGQGAPQILAPTAPISSNTQFGDAGDFV